MALIAFWPTPVDKGAGPWLSSFIATLHSLGVPKWFSYSAIEFGSNIIFFLPFGFLAMWASRKVWLSLLLGFCVSAMIEFCQFLFLPARFPSAWDVLANSLGSLIGALTFAAIARLMARRQLNTV